MQNKDYTIEIIYYNSTPNRFGNCNIKYKALFSESNSSIETSESSCEVCNLLNKSFVDVIKYISNEIDFSLESDALSDQFQKNMNKKLNGKFPSQEDVQEFGSQYRRLRKKFEEDYT